jgi:hypothetical protein
MTQILINARVFVRERRRFANLELPLNLVINPSHIPHIVHISKGRRLPHILACDRIQK